MKSCPTCNRTFEDTFTFCLIDGSILSAPFDPHATRQIPNARNTDPQTEVMPPSNFPNRDALPPTIPSPQPGYTPPPISNAVPYPQYPQFSQGQPAVNSPLKKRPPIPWSIPIVLVGLVLLVLIFGGRDKLLSLWGLFIAIILSVINLTALRLNTRNTTPPNFPNGRDVLPPTIAAPQAGYVQPQPMYNDPPYQQSPQFFQGQHISAKVPPFSFILALVVGVIPFLLIYYGLLPFR